jgi:putative solute:sodium symporter small subunit
MPPSPPESSPARAAANNGNGNAYWRSVIRLTLLLLGIWALVSIVAAIVLVELLNTLKVGRLPAGFWLAQQGSIVVFVALIFIYARRMDRIDHQYRKDLES